MAVVELLDVSIVRSGATLLDGIAWTVEEDERWVIIGPNGAGKTTMMDVITGKTRPDEGDALFEGERDLTKLDETEIALLGIGRKFQKPTVFDMHSVEDNLLLALKNNRTARAAISQPMVGARLAATVATRKIATPITSGLLRPTASDIGP